MEKYENLTLDQMSEKTEELKGEGFAETQPIEVVEVGKYSGNPVIIGKGANKSASFSVVCFERTTKTGETLKLMFQGCKFNLTNIETSKEYSDVLVKVTDEMKEKYSTPANLTKAATLESVPYTDGQGRNRTIVKLMSIAK